MPFQIILEYPFGCLGLHIFWGNQQGSEWRRFLSGILTGCPETFETCLYFIAWPSKQGWVHIVQSSGLESWYEDTEFPQQGSGAQGHQPSLLPLAVRLRSTQRSCSQPWSGCGVLETLTLVSLSSKRQTRTHSLLHYKMNFNEVNFNHDIPKWILQSRGDNPLWALWCPSKALRIKSSLSDTRAKM